MSATPSEHVLISPLGRSPGAVSGVYFGLQDRHMPVSKVVTVGTGHGDVKKAADYLRQIFAHLNVSYEPIFLPEEELRGGKRSVMPYASMIGLVIEKACETFDRPEVHVAVTGGRSGMGALAALAAQLYGASKLWHLWVALEIEANGTVDKLQPALNGEALCSNKVLNPTLAGKQAWDLVDLPFVDLRPLQPYIRLLHKNKELTSTQPALDEFVQKLRIQDLFEVFPAGMTFAQGERCLELIRRVRLAKTLAEQQTALLDLGVLLESAGMIGSGERSELVNALLSVDTLAELNQRFEKSKGLTSLWRKLKEYESQIKSITSIATALPTVVTVLHPVIAGFLDFLEWLISKL